MIWRKKTSKSRISKSRHVQSLRQAILQGEHQLHAQTRSLSVKNNWKQNREHHQRSGSQLVHILPREDQLLRLQEIQLQDLQRERLQGAQHLLQETHLHSTQGIHREITLLIVREEILRQIRQLAQETHRHAHQGAHHHRIRGRRRREATFR